MDPQPGDTTNKKMSECAVCSTPAPHKCAGCKSVSYCSPAHQKEDWKAHKKVCPRLAQKAKETEERLILEAKDSEELLLRITTCLAQNGYHAEVGVMVQLNKAFWWDEQIWDAYKDVRGGGKDGRTRLIYAVAAGNLKRVTWLLARGARVDIGLLGNGDPVLLIACGRGRLEIAKLLIEKGAQVNAANMYGCTVLMQACIGNHLDVVRMLLEKGADVNAATTDGRGTNALIIAGSNNNLKILRLLLEKGANVNSTTTGGLTALIGASRRGCLEIIRCLIDKGANVNAASTEHGFTALMGASVGGNVEVARLLIKHGADKSAVNFDGGTAAGATENPILQALLEP